MKPLHGHVVGFVAHERTAAPRAQTLRDAGATVRIASPELDLWAAVGESAFDALVIQVSEREPSASAILAALEGDARTRQIPVLVLVEMPFARELVQSAVGKCMTILSAAAQDDAVVQAVVQLSSVGRAFQALEDQHRVQIEQLRSLMARGDNSRAELHDVAHDLRALLGIAFGFACNLRDHVVGPLSVDQREHVMRILEASRDATALLDRTKDSTRTPRAMPARASPSVRLESARPGRAQRTLVDLGALAESVKVLFEHGAQGQSKTIGCVAEPVTVWGDALKLKQVVVNLVGNAIKYTPVGGDISVIVRWGRPAEATGPAARRRAEIVVSNSGSVIAPEARRKIFERGFRQGEHSHLPGEGVGLSIVKDVVAQHGGTVTAETKAGEETVFTVSLPTDMRVRDRDLGVLLVPESEAASVLIDAIRSARTDELVAMMADRPREFLDLVAACGAFVVVPRDKVGPLSEALSEILTPFSQRGPSA